ncbi:amino acid ABC transporter substrate-binding protein [Acinetobacter sp. MD2(2019)]|uniref:amino acid ABC transporter substrate-binding protein n=1 Tax=Acinetobacter sp. MD2(2019) TaxID=2605273 RepID=UPI002D1F2705|nr:amino acid ABC transporter substrate-binding protein [Acinetobacter sp. MD2(2019)]MEB3753587.1 amino acid ABC transporter substrate-binding protein [Acinetobacter sp. MD2(2019)]
MNNILKSTLTTVVLASLSFGASQVYAVDTLNQIKERGKINIGFNDTSMPISYVVNGAAAGYAIDICRNIASNIRKQLNAPNLKIEFIPLTPGQRMDAIMNGRIDMECGSTTNSYKRQQQVSFSTNFYYTEVRMAVKKSTHFEDLSDLNNKVVSTSAGTTSTQYIKRDSRGRDVTVRTIYGHDMDDSFNLLVKGKSEAFVMDDNILAGLIAKSAKPDDYEIVGPVLSSEPYAVMLPKGDEKLKALADSTIIGLWKSGEMMKLYRKWFQSAIPPKNINLNMAPNRSYLNLQRRPTDAGV